MACYELNTTNSTTVRNDSIYDLLKRIERMQKEAVAAINQGPCDTCLLTPTFNTKPIAVYLCEGLFTAEGEAGAIINRFRVEEVRGDVVILRLLLEAEGELTCTNLTVTCRIGCICAIQCFDPITCTINCPLAV